MGKLVRGVLVAGILSIFSIGAYAQTTPTVVVIPMFGDDAAAKWRGAWADDVDYKKGDLVHDLGSSYIATSDHTSDDTNDPQDTFTAWDLVAASGANGINGDDGDDGAKGDTGLLDQATLDYILKLFSHLSKTVFVTSSAYNGDLVSAANALSSTVYTNGLLAGNALCQAHADSAGLYGTYKAWLSDSTGSPSSTFIQASIPYVLTDGTKIADNYAGLIGSGVVLDAPISLTENATLAPTSNVWTGTETDGTATNMNCSDWKASSVTTGTRGVSWSATEWRTNTSNRTCENQYALYCFQQ